MSKNKDNKLEEATLSNASVGADDGPSVFYPSNNAYKEAVTKDLKKYVETGWEIISHIIDDEEVEDNPTSYKVYPDGPVRSVSFFPAGDLDNLTPMNQQNLFGSEAYEKWKQHTLDTIAKIGYTWIQTQQGDENEEESVDNAEGAEEEAEELEKKEKEMEKKLKEYFMEMKNHFKKLKEGRNDGHIEIEGDTVYADTNFVNKSKGVLPDSELKHMGMGEFYLDTPDGEIEFIRTGKDTDEFRNFVGRVHRLEDDRGGELVSKLVKAMIKHNKAVKEVKEGCGCGCGDSVMVTLKEYGSGDMGVFDGDVEELERQVKSRAQSIGKDSLDSDDIDNWMRSMGNLNNYTKAQKENLRKAIKKINNQLNEAGSRDRIETGDRVHIPSINKSGVVLKVYGKKIHVKFPDNTEKTFNRDEVELLADNRMNEGVETRKQIEKFVNTFNNTKKGKFGSVGGQLYYVFNATNAPAQEMKRRMKKAGIGDKLKGFGTNKWGIKIDNETKRVTFKDGKVMESMNEAYPKGKIDAKKLAKKMRNTKTMKGLADKIEKKGGKISADELDKMLPDYVPGEDIRKLFEVMKESAGLDHGAVKDVYRNADRKEKKIFDKAIKQLKKGRLSSDYDLIDAVSEVLYDYTWEIFPSAGDTAQFMDTDDIVDIVDIMSTANESMNEGRTTVAKGDWVAVDGDTAKIIKTFSSHRKAKKWMKKQSGSARIASYEEWDKKFGHMFSGDEKYLNEANMADTLKRNFKNHIKTDVSTTYPDNLIHVGAGYVNKKTDDGNFIVVIAVHKNEEKVKFWYIVKVDKNGEILKIIEKTKNKPSNISQYINEAGNMRDDVKKVVDKVTTAYKVEPDGVLKFRSEYDAEEAAEKLNDAGIAASHMKGRQHGKKTNKYVYLEAKELGKLKNLLKEESGRNAPVELKYRNGSLQIILEPNGDIVLNIDVDADMLIRMIKKEGKVKATTGRYYYNTMNESINEAVKPSDTIQKVLDIADSRQSDTVNGTKVDSTTAHMIAKVWDKASDRNKKKMNSVSVDKLAKVVDTLKK